MKTLLSGFVAAGFVCAASISPGQVRDSGPTGTTDPISSPSTEKTGEGSTSSGASLEGIVMRDRKLYYVKGGKTELVNNELRLSEGITVQEGGHIILKNGERINLQNGQFLTLEGKIVSDPMNPNASGTPAAGAGIQSGGSSPETQSNTSGLGRDDIATQKAGLASSGTSGPAKKVEADSNLSGTTAESRSTGGDPKGNKQREKQGSRGDTAPSGANAGPTGSGM
jgi:hypothetical protein